MLKRFLPYYKPYLGIVVIDLLCAGLSTVCELVFPMIVRQITNSAAAGITDAFLPMAIRLVVIYLFLRIVDTVANYYMAYIGHVMGVRLETDMRRDLFAHLERLSFSFYDNAKVGQLMSRITNDLFDVTEFSHHCPEEFFIAGLKIVGSFLILAGVNIWMTLIIFALLPLMLTGIIFFRRNMKRGFKETRVQTAELNAMIEDSLTGIRVVKSFANEPVEQEKFDRENNKFLKIKSFAYRYMALFQGSTRFMDGVMYVAVILVGSIFMANGFINGADLVAYLLYIQTLLTTIRRIVEFAEQFQKGTTGIERFFEIMDEPVAIKDKENPVVMDKVEGEIKFENVSFSYSEEGEKVLDNINIDVKKGESIALVGPSGGGKTTLCSLIPRFYDVTDGKVTLDGVDVRDISLDSLRKNIGVVQQDVYLFNGTVRENIAYGKENPTEEEIITAAKLAGAHEFILGLSEGYDTYVGERGVKLSGGQKQRISIARLFLKNPPVLILDEATSALDNESELLVQQSLERLAKDRTTFIIAHRLTTIRNAARIFVLTEEGIAEVGTHKELMEKKGEYYKLYSMYSQRS